MLHHTRLGQTFWPILWVYLKSPLCRGSTLCWVDVMLGQPYVRSTLCWVDLMLGRPYVGSTLCWVALMLGRPYVGSTLCRVDLMLGWPYVVLTLCQVDLMSCRPYVGLTLCWVDLMLGRPYVGSTLCRVDLSSGWHFVSQPHRRQVKISCSTLSWKVFHAFYNILGQGLETYRVCQYCFNWKKQPSYFSSPSAPKTKTLKRLAQHDNIIKLCFMAGQHKL